LPEGMHDAEMVRTRLEKIDRETKRLDALVTSFSKLLGGNMANREHLEQKQQGWKDEQQALREEKDALNEWEVHYRRQQYPWHLLATVRLDGKV